MRSLVGTFRAAVLALALAPACAGDGSRPASGASRATVAVLPASAPVGDLPTVPSPSTSASARPELPVAASDREGVPRVTIDVFEVRVDGIPVAAVPPLASAGKLVKIDGLFEALRARREATIARHPSEPFDGAAVFEIAREVAAGVVKSAFQTAAFAGYPNLSFAVLPAASASAAPAARTSP